MIHWEEIFGTEAVPDWLLDFARDPFTAVDAALWRRYYFGSLNVADPADLLIDWALGIGKRNDFVQRLDETLAQWIRRNWGQNPGAEGRRSAAKTAVAWIRLANVVANVDALQEAPRMLRQYFDDREAYLGPLSEGPSRDPLGRYLYAVARHQEDRSLLPVWWEYCDLVPGIPWHHGLYGIWGLRGFPPVTEEERGRFPEYVAIGLVQLAIALYRRKRERSLTLNDARAEFQRVARLTMMAYPFPERWEVYWSDQIASKKISKEPVEWMRQLVPGLSKKQSRREDMPAILTPSPTWKSDATRISNFLQRDFQTALPEAEELVKAERRYAEKTGDSFPLCRSLTRFANDICEKYPEQAVRWAEEARLWEPWNAYPWTVLIKAIRQDRTRSDDSALNVAWEAIERFPDDLYARSGLAEVLKEAGRLREAEEVYRETIERFPDDVVARNGLANVLKDAGNLGEAEAIYRGTMRKFPDDVVARTGRAEVLKDAGRLEDAEAVYRETIDKFPDDVVALTALAATLRLLGKDRLSEASTLVDRVLKGEPTNAEAWMEKGRILAELDQHEEANAAFEHAHMPALPKVTLPAEYGEKPKQDINHTEAKAISAYARFLRQWARRNEVTSESPSPSELRARAVGMLDELILTRPYETRARAEKGLLLLESKEYEEAKRFLKESIALFPGEAALRYALARTERELARRERRRFDPAQADIVTAEWNRLRLLNPAFGPLEDLGKGRAWLVQLDGHIVREKALGSFKHIRQWMRPYLRFIGNGGEAQNNDPVDIRRLYAKKKGFAPWWSREIQAYLFGPIDINVALEDEHLDLIGQRLGRYHHAVDTLEEDFALRLAGGMVGGIAGQGSGGAL